MCVLSCFGAQSHLLGPYRLLHILILITYFSHSTSNIVEGEDSEIRTIGLDRIYFDPSYAHMNPFVSGVN